MLHRVYILYIDEVFYMVSKEILEQIAHDGYTGSVDNDGILRISSTGFKSLKEMTGYIDKLGYRGSWGTILSKDWR